MLRRPLTVEAVGHDFLRNLFWFFAIFFRPARPRLHPDNIQPDCLITFNRAACSVRGRWGRKREGAGT